MTITFSSPQKIILALYLIYNAIVFLIYAYDKGISKLDRVKLRISEHNLLLLAVFFGGIGALFGMLLLRHKTRHTSFRIVVPLCAVWQVALLVWFFINCNAWWAS